jgi:hypothetical protein
MSIARTLFAAALAFASLGAAAQTPNPSFSLLGYIQELDVDDLADPLSSGRVRVNGIDVVLPKNLLITMPGQYLTLNDLFRGKVPAPTASKPSGLALTDAAPPRVPFEIQLIGNIVAGRYIAGVAKVTQQDLNEGAGFIRAIDHAKGELLVGPPTGTAVARVRLNDPQGRHGKPNAAKFTGPNLMDERFSLDPDNAAVVAETGFPMCIPDNAAGDANCPSTNRHPSERRFTCGPISVEPTAPALPGCDPAKRAPLQVGDYIGYAGMLVEDAPGKFFIAAHALGAKTGIYTSPGRDPSYVFIEETIVGVLGEIFPPIDQEETSRFRIVGFATDPSRTIDVFMVDVAPDGVESERLMTRLQPSLVGQIGRFRATLPSKANFLPATRDVRARLTAKAAPTVNGGAPTPFQYTIPVGEYIYPENTRFGQKPSFPVPVPFENFCFLKNGGGPLTTLGRSAGPLIKKLDPFPESGHTLSQGRADGTRACP